MTRCHVCHRKIPQGSHDAYYIVWMRSWLWRLLHRKLHGYAFCNVDCFHIYNIQLGIHWNESKEAVG